MCRVLSVEKSMKMPDPKLLTHSRLNFSHGNLQVSRLSAIRWLL